MSTSDEEDNDSDAFDSESSDNEESEEENTDPNSMFKNKVKGQGANVPEIAKSLKNLQKDRQRISF